MINYDNNNTIIFTLARMNPPTPGHLYLIRRLIEEGIQKNVDTVYVILSKTVDADENPISCPEKINILGSNKSVVDSMIYVLIRQMINEIKNNNSLNEIQKNAYIEKLNNMNVVSICVPDIPRATPFTPIGRLIQLKENANINEIHLFLIIGDDRANILDNIADVYFFNNDKIKSMDGLVLNRLDMTTFKKLNPEELSIIDISTVPIGAFSASFVRNLVKYGLKEKFNNVYSPYLNQLKIDELYNSIQRSFQKGTLNVLPIKKKRESIQKPLKYNYPLIKNQTQVTQTISNKRKRGGKKTMKKKTMKKNKKTRKRMIKTKRCKTNKKII